MPVGILMAMSAFRGRHLRFVVSAVVVVVVPVTQRPPVLLGINPTHGAAKCF